MTRPCRFASCMAQCAARPNRRTALAALAVACASPYAALAQDTRPITLVVGYTPGSAFDTVARSVSDLAGKQLGHPSS